MYICCDEQCTGCCACMNACPVNAISMVNRNNSLVPEINDDKCIKCKRCREVCQVIHPVEVNHVNSVFAACNKDCQEKRKSASGGIAAGLAKRIVHNGGIAIGATVSDGTVKHISVHRETELDLLKGSKYVQSFIGETYKDCRKYLKEKKKVIFFGTPCQIAGLKAYLGKQVEDSNLITVDLICHGVPTFEVLKNYIDHVAKEWDSFSFRGENGWNLCIMHRGEVRYQCPAKEDPYFYSFLNGLNYRENCYKCVYANVNRCSDITLGDFWGLDKECKDRLFDGEDASVVLINTLKGKQFFDLYKEDYVWEVRTIEEAANQYQENLLHASTKHKDRDIYIQNLQQYNSVFKALAKTPSIKRMIFEKRKNKIINLIKVFVKKITV